MGYLMNILLSNDDGVKSPGLRLLAKRLSKNHNVIIVAPNDNRSGASTSLTVRKPVTIKEEFFNDDIKTYSTTGSPADCVKMAHHLIKDFKIDLVVSGINNGYNIGTDIYYSGTMGAAFQGAILGYKSIAFSISYNSNFLTEYIDLAINIIEKISCQSHIVWNVNFPAVSPLEIKGIKYTSVGDVLYSDYYEQCGDNSYQLKGELLYNPNCENDCDVNLIRDGYVTISPVSMDRTDHFVLNNNII